VDNGAFALIDCLGFKGIWKRYENEHNLLMAKLRSISKHAEIAANKAIGPEDISLGEGKLKIQVKLLSDTVAISLCGIKKSISPGFVLLTMQQVVREIMELFINDRPHLFVRGCITYGKHVTERNFLVGPAVDATAEHMDSAQGSFVWFLPPASEILDEWFAYKYNNFRRPESLPTLKKIYEMVSPKYSVPIKGGHHLNAYVVNPLYDKSSEDSEKIMSMCNDFMAGNSMDIWMKRQHTIDFLNHCKELNTEGKRAAAIFWPKDPDASNQPLEPSR